MLRKITISFVIAVIAILALAIVIPAYIRAHSTKAAFTRCEFNLMIIDECKINWQNVHHKPADYVLTMDDLKDELRSYAIQYGWTNGVPTCPDGGTYIIGRVGEKPKCSVGGRGHSISW
jgi:hypothetical protein